MADPDYICLAGHGVSSRTASGAGRPVARGFLRPRSLWGRGRIFFSAYCMPGAPKALALVVDNIAGGLIESRPVALADLQPQILQKRRARLRQLVAEPR